MGEGVSMECEPYLYFHHLTRKLTLCFYTYKYNEQGQGYIKKEPCELEISEAEARTKYPTIYAAALENFEKRQGITQTQKDEAIIEISQPAKEGIEQVVVSA